MLYRVVFTAMGKKQTRDVMIKKGSDVLSAVAAALSIPASAITIHDHFKKPN